jgi:5-methylcytosine-specific restriction protein A
VDTISQVTAAAVRGFARNAAGAEQRRMEGRVAEGDGWTEGELRASVGAYLEMLSLEQAGTSFSKAEYRRALRAGPLASRIEPSIEYRMRNVSAALEELCLPWIVGYRPAKTVGNKVKDHIHELLREAGWPRLISRSQPKHMRTWRSERGACGSARERPCSTAGPESPRRTSGTSSHFVRDPLVRAWVLEASSGRCEACGAAAPFVELEGKPYLEVHHVVTLAEGGPDTVENAVAVCPNCHRRLHLGHDRADVRARLYLAVFRLEQ